MADISLETASLGRGEGKGRYEGRQAYRVSESSHLRLASSASHGYEGWRREEREGWEQWTITATPA